MRIIGFVLVILGLLALGYESWVRLVHESEQAVSVSPVAAGIVLVSGLLVLTAASRRSEA